MISLPARCEKSGVENFKSGLNFSSIHHYIVASLWQVDIIFWVGGTKVIHFPASYAQPCVKKFSACGGLNFFTIGNSL